ncbi:heat shock protein beta-1-like [Amblyraja radiata]|uniref:heat shock protein beta-1-like n=1 Tax=Amblyraja radiata TaxID=386614 RepID=UPI001403FFAE|nr:heat shock protein beta-1-like [Amblyraja radiata]
MSLSHFFPRSYWDPLRRGYSPSCLLDLDFGLPPYPEQPLRDWMEWMENRFSTSRAGTLCSGPADNATASHSTSSISQPLARGTSVPQRKLSCWKISLDVKHFTPDELQVKTQEGYLEISGSHNEREDQHGFISRCFTRKYRLPSAVAARSVTSTLTSNGILVVEAPLRSSLEVVIPVQTEKVSGDDEKVKKEEEPVVGKEVWRMRRCSTLKWFLKIKKTRKKHIHQQVK